ncbi:Embryogenesis-associated protein EMB8 [Platanthera zijinensis]|uniref:Embryogenesis-associated protein EMB8 n=1 Tax=Platanthera zijinensis TaxID=2320716 RepID=A0AAP0B9N7_9ASPA
MNLRCVSPHLDPSPPIIHRGVRSINRHGFRHGQQRHLRRRFPALRCQFGLESFFNTLNSVSPLDLLAPFFGFASAAAAVYLRSSARRPDSAAFGDWILFTSPTPFNRCVLLRCPSVSFENEGELVNSVNDRLVREQQHYVNLNQGRIPLKDDVVAGFEKDLKFQRFCVRTDDGGVISMDWPDYLDLEKEHGLDTTVLIIPGTPEGSMNREVKLFVLDIVKHGCFPIVMNPRGCAGSPLTTPRLFTPADSDDVSTAVQFVNEIRPWTTLMGIGWGYGANMLTKYLAESGVTTPVTAAVCIDTPFDLEESTKSSSQHITLNKKLTNGLREILRANKEIFQGKTKGFDVSKALSATSVRDFDGAVSMISYGFDSLENFYRESCTRQLIDKLKIPLLFIQWLSAVEHALLKGRHPLLNDVDIAIKPYKGLAVNNDGAEKSVSASSINHRRDDPSQLLSRNYHENVDSVMKLTDSDTVNGLRVYPDNTESNEDDGAFYDNAIDHNKSGRKFHETQRQDEHDGKNEKLGTDKDIQTENVGAEDVANAISGGGGQVTQTATVIMNMLDVTMPGTLDDEHKKKVLSAMEQGETFMKALQGAVPEDVRGKMTTSVADIMRSQSTNLNFDAVKQISRIPNVTSELKSKIHEKIKGSSPKELSYDDATLDQRKVGKSNGDGSEGSIGPPQEKDAQSSLSIDAGSELEDKTNQPNKPDQVGGRTNQDGGEQYEITEKLDASDTKSDQSQTLGDDATTADDCAAVDSLNSSISNLSNSEESSSAGSFPHQVPGEEGSQNNDENSTQDSISQNVQSSSKSEETSPQILSSESHSVSVSQALDALTRFDDSTQMAVNSVFGVIESMIDQLEKSNQDFEEVKETGDQRSIKGFNDPPLINGEESSNLASVNNGSSTGPYLSQPATQPENLFNDGDAEYYEYTIDQLGSSKINHSSAPSSDEIIKHFEQDDIEASTSCSTNLRKYGDTTNLTPDAAMKRYWLLLYASYLNRYFTKLPNMKFLDLETATDLFLDSEEGRWKMIDQPSSSIITTGRNGKLQNSNFASKRSDEENAVEPFNAIIDGVYSKCDNEVCLQDDKNNNEDDNSMKEKLVFLIKNTLLNDLKIEVCRRIGLPDSKEFDSILADDLENFTDAVSRAVVSYSDIKSFKTNIGAKLVKFGTVDGQQTVEIMLSALKDAVRLREVLPFGVIVGTSLASLLTYFQVVALHDDAKKMINSPVNKRQKSNGHENDTEDEHSVVEKVVQDEYDLHLNSNKSIDQGYEKIETVGSASGGIIAGAVTAALGASALGASALLENHQKKYRRKESKEIPSNKTVDLYDNSNRSLSTAGEYLQERSQNSIVSNLAEKAMSVTGPIMPTTSDGEVDHQRLVAILAELGNKGGMLRFVGKVAMLWGGMRGAFSLTDRLISFLHLSERPLFQRNRTITKHGEYACMHTYS